MTPYEIKIMLHYYTTPREYEGNGEPILDPTLEDFCKRGLLKYDKHEGMHVITNKGKAFVDFLCEIPDPVEDTRWKFSLAGMKNTKIEEEYEEKELA